MFKEGNLDFSKIENQKILEKKLGEISPEEKQDFMDEKHEEAEEFQYSKWDIELTKEEESTLREFHLKGRNMPDSLETQRENFEGTLEYLRTEIELHEISCIVGDDKSGRVPALILGKTVNEIYRQKNDSTVPILFIDPKMYKYISGKTPITAITEEEKRHEESLNSVKKSISDLFAQNNITGGTMLFITDYIAYGTTIKAFEKIAKENGLKIKIAQSSTWHAQGSGDVPSLGNSSGLTSVYSFGLSGPVIHAENVWKKIKKEKDIGIKIEYIKGIAHELRCENYVEGLGWIQLLTLVKNDEDFNFPGEIIAKATRQENWEETEKIEELLKNELTNEQWEMIFNYIHKVYFLNVRKKIPQFSKELAEKFQEK